MPSRRQHESRSVNEVAVIDESIVADLPVSGTLPAALSGQYVRIGPNGIDAARFRSGRASYWNGSITTDATTVISFGRSILAFGDGALASELSAGLETVCHVDLAGAGRRLTTHPKIDPITGDLHLLTFATDQPQLHVTVSSGGLTRTVRSIDNAPNRIRQLELTRDDVVFLTDGFVGVTDRAGPSAKTVWFRIETDERSIATAHANGRSVVVYATGPSLVEWTLDRGTASANCRVVDATPHRFAGINSRPSGATHRFLWTVGSGRAHKHDLLTGARRSHDFGSGRHPDQLVFIADPDRGSAEDGGWLVGFVHDDTTNKADFVVLDAQAIERPAIAVAHLPRRLRPRMHGTWIPAAQI